MKKLFIALLIGISIYGYINKNPNSIFSSPPEKRVKSEQAVADAYQKQLSGIQTSGSGDVIRILSDDNKGSRHQRFVLRLSSGQTLLVAHNIDLAPRISHLNKGDVVQYCGKYEWNSEGGVIHWTHHDPSGRQAGGWLKHKGQKYD